VGEGGRNWGVGEGVSGGGEGYAMHTPCTLTRTCT